MKLEIYTNEFLTLLAEHDIKHNLNEYDLVERVYTYYKYFNADETKFEDMISSSSTGLIKYIGENENSLDILDLITTINCTNLDDLADYLLRLEDYLADTFNGRKTPENIDIINILISKKIDENKIINCILIFTNQVSDEFKKESLKLITNFKSQLKNLEFNLIYIDDVNEVISEIESPSLFVESGSITLTDKNQIMFYGSEKSIVTSISAKSIKNLYLNFASKGLFSSNLRYYVKSTKIDDSIKDSILNEPEKFWYFNNGLIITCHDYFIEGDQIKLRNFSIVNGGQTTNLIGSVDFDTDFSVICKIIKPKYETKDQNTMFLSKIAETSNTQKPIKTKDLIANRIEQTKLKEQMAALEIFVQVKRGEKINKNAYPLKWQNTTNEEIGQQLFSYMYQNPGKARNNKSLMLSNEKYYNTIYRNEYNPFLIATLQHFKVGYLNWGKKLLKSNDKGPVKIGLAKNGFFYALAIFGLINKIYYNKELRKYIIDSKTDFNSDEFKKIISANDIGQIDPFFNSSMLSESVIVYSTLFNLIFDQIFIPSFNKAKLLNPTVAYSNFTKVDTHYYNYVVKRVATLVKGEWEYIDSVLSKIIRPNSFNIKINSSGILFDDYKPGLEIELNEYRSNISKSSKGELKSSEIFNKTQITRLVFLKPDSLFALKSDCYLTDSIINQYGTDILKIIAKYRGNE